MDRNETRRRRIARVARDLRSLIRREALGRWSEVRVAERNEQGRHVWRFRPGPGQGERFLHIEHRAMVRGRDAAARLREQLTAERWLDRLQQGPATALLLSSDGRLAALPEG